MKKILSLLLVVLLTFSVFAFDVFAESEYGTVVDSGLCCSNLICSNAQWILYEDGTLVISGEGGVISPDECPFSGCDKNDLLPREDITLVKKVIFEEGLTSIDDGFRSYYNLTEIVFPKSLTKIRSEAFYNCFSLEVFIPEHIEEISNFAFGYIKSITVDENNPYYSSDEYGVLFNKDKTELLVYPSNAENTEYTVPDGVVKIHNTAHYCQNLIELTFPESVREISAGAFAMNAVIETVNLSEGVEIIGELAFSMCPKLKNVVFPASLKKLGDYCFTDCYFLDDIKIKSTDAVFPSMHMGIISIEPADGVSEEQWLELYKNEFDFEYFDDSGLLYENSNMFEVPQTKDSAVIYIHDDEQENTAEAYAETYGIPVERIHFYGEWEYDWENYVRTRKCDLCEMTETEALEKESDGDVEIIAPEDSDTDFEVDKVEDDNDSRYILAKEVLSKEQENDFEIVKLFDINLKNKDGVHVQPDGTVKVKLPHDWKHDNYKVYRVNDDGTLTDMNAYRQGSHIVFDTDHFSVYVIVDESGTASEETPEEAPEEENSIVKLWKAFIGFMIKLFNCFTEFLQALKNI